MEPLTRVELDRVSVLEALGAQRTGHENNVLQVFWLRQWLLEQAQLQKDTA